MFYKNRILIFSHKIILDKNFDFYLVILFSKLVIVPTPKPLFYIGKKNVLWGCTILNPFSQQTKKMLISRPLNLNPFRDCRHQIVETRSLPPNLRAQNQPPTKLTINNHTQFIKDTRHNYKHKYATHHQPLTFQKSKDPRILETGRKVSAYWNKRDLQMQIGCCIDSYEKIAASDSSINSFLLSSMSLPFLH